MRSSIVALAITVLSLTACASTVWERQATTQADYSVDTNACERESTGTTYPGAGLARKMIILQIYDRCMVGYGYKKVAIPKSSDQNARTIIARS
jgi:hypothetical protein